MRALTRELALSWPELLSSVHSSRQRRNFVAAYVFRTVQCLVLSAFDWNRTMTFLHEASWSLGVISHSFEERHVLMILGSSLRQIYGDVDTEPLPTRLQELLHRLDQTG